MNRGTAFSYTRRLIRAAVAVFFVSAVFGAAVWAQDDGDYDAVIDEGTETAQPVADEPVPTDSPDPTVADQNADVQSGDGASSDGSEGGQQVVSKKDRGDKAGAAIDTTPLFAKPDFELGFGLTTVDGHNWGRIALGVDIPIWKFGVFLDLELFITNKFKVSDKGWDFKDNTAEAVLRKIRYIRFGHEDEPLFIKFGGLSNVSLGYGMIVDRFTNMLRYPDEKLLGLQFYLNDISQIGLTLQTLISDFAEMGDKGGVYGVRLAVRPFKMSEILWLNGVSVGGMYAADANVHAPASKWTPDGDTASLDSFGKTARQSDSLYLDSLRRRTRSFGLYGFDVTVPIIRTDPFGIDLYAQSAFRADGVSGWGIGVPGVAARVWVLSGNLEYRIVRGRFMPGYFDTYYLEERYSRGLRRSKDETMMNVSLGGIYGRVGMNISDILTLDGTYQYMTGKDVDRDSALTIRYYEAAAGLGKAIMDHIPMFNLAEAYVRNADIGKYRKYGKDGNPETNKTAGPFDRSPGLYMGYRAGFEIFVGWSLILDYRYGWKVEDDGKLASDNHINLHTAMRF